MSKCPSSIWCQDSNPRPFEHESSPITTRPGLRQGIKLYYMFTPCLFGLVQWALVKLSEVKTAQLLIAKDHQIIFENFLVCTSQVHSS